MFSKHVGIVFIITFMLSVTFLLVGIIGIKSKDSTPTHCYAKAMVGHDSVINKHAGTPLLTSLSIDNREEYDRIIKEAYVTELSAHDYGLKVYTDCITK